MLETVNNSVSARELYLGMASDQWSRWSKINIVENEFFTQDIDFIRNDIKSNPTNGVAIKDFIVTIEFAKHIAMMAKTQRAHDYRNYFIECEKIAKGEIQKLNQKPKAA
ncbi:MAG: antA/AntB antirepressor family protein [Methylococcaceae bacterium]